MHRLSFFYRVLFLGALLFACSAWGQSAYLMDGQQWSPVDILVPPAAKARYVMPYRVGDVLVIEGTLDSHIYDFIRRDTGNLSSVKWVNLNSHGGLRFWGLELGRLIREMGWRTRVQASSVCMSACLYAFMGGVEREAEWGSAFVLHGVQVHPVEVGRLHAACIEMNGRIGSLHLEKEECQKVLQPMQERVKELTKEAFRRMEELGLSPALAIDYSLTSDEPGWVVKGNLFRKRDWLLTHEQLLQYNLVTPVL